ncbi:MAG: hypothetical protein AB9836_08160 [Aminipila sp.]
MNNQINTESYDEEEIKQIVKDFFRAYYSSERVEMFNYLDPDFQRYVPLDYFLIHPDFYRNLGVLLEIRKIRIKEEKEIALVECLIDLQKQKKELVIAMKKDSGVWKINGKRMFR